MLMSLTFSPEIEDRLNREAYRRGVTSDVIVREIVEKELLALPESTETPEEVHERQIRRKAKVMEEHEKAIREGAALWAAMTPEEREKEEAEFEELRRALDDNRR